MTDAPTARMDATAEVPDRDTFATTLDRAIERIDSMTDRFEHCYPSADTGGDLRYDEWPVEDWTPSFWTGLCWLAYEETGDELYRSVASGHLDDYADRLRGEIDVDPDDYDRFHAQGVQTHDLGFLYSLSAVAQYWSTGEERARQVGLEAAEHLADRYQPAPGIIQAWGHPADSDNEDRYGKTIIDSMMNLPLLFWAAEETGYDRYREICIDHADAIATHFVREDNSTLQTFQFDVESGEPLGQRGGAEYRDDTCWARGQAWAIYGFALTYTYTGEPRFRDVACDLADYHLEHTEADLVPRWDYQAPADHHRDTSAAAIIACGLLELAGHLPPVDDDRQRYQAAGLATLGSLIDSYATLDEDVEAMLTESNYANFDPADQPENGTIWGDYYFVEGLIRATTDRTTFC